MKPFLQNIAEKIYEIHAGNMQNVAVVFPNRRPIVFFRKYLSEIIDKPVWQPNLISIEDFILSNSKIELADNLSLLIYLYKSYKNANSSYKKDFADFLKWGNTLLNDFQEIDQNLLDAVEIFNYLTEEKVIELWNVENSELSQFEKDYLQYYRSFAPCYEEFVELLLSNNIAYYGLIIKKFVNELKIENFDKYSKIYFVGFNALTESEKTLIEFLIKNNKAEAIFDADAYYIADNKEDTKDLINLQEAGRFLRKYKYDKTFGEFSHIENNLTENEKEIAIAGVSSASAQTKIIGNTIETWVKNGANPEDIAIVLNDENLLLPILNSIPQNIEHVNVTMGYPFRLTASFTFIDALFSLFSNTYKHLDSENSLRINPVAKNDLSTFLLHPYFNNLLINQIDIYEINKNDYYSIKKTTDFFKNYLNKDVSKLLTENFGEKISSNDIFDLCINLLEIILGENTDNVDVSENISDGFAIKNKTEIEYISFTIYLLQNLLTTLKTNEIELPVQTLNIFIGNIIKNEKITLEGKPLKGIQIMGMLETRLLDFENVALLSTNEGVLPQTSRRETFMTNTIRKHYSLLDKSGKNAIYAYHFYRLIQRAKQVEIIYTTESVGTKNNEKSRFVQQLEIEFLKKNTKSKIINKIYAPKPLVKTSKPQDITKTEALQALLINYLGNGISPSALNDYLACQLKFYFKNIVKIKSDNNATTLDSATIGTVVHNVLAELYKNEIGKTLTTESLKVFLNSISNITKSKLNEQFQEINTETGENYLNKKLIEKLVENFVKAEINRLNSQGNKLIINKLEENLEYSFEVQIPNSDKKIKVMLKGIADRIEQHNNHICIADYKTGKVDAKDLIIGDLSDREMLENSPFIVQLMTYALMYIRQNAAESQVQCGIYSLISPSSNLINVTINNNATLNAEVFSKFEKFIKDKIKEMADTEIPYKATENQKNCEFCDYNKICFLT